MDEEIDLNRVEEPSRALDTFARARLPPVPAQGTPLSQCPSNLPDDTPYGKAMRFKATGESDYKPTPEAPARFVAHWWSMFPDVRADDKTGEIREFVTVCLYTADHKVFKSSGVASPGRLFALLQLYTPEEWAKGIPIVVYAKARPGRAPMHSIEVDMSAM